MKTTIQKYLCAAVVFVILTVMVTPNLYAAEWLDDWFGNKISNGAGSFTGQQRGYVTGGSFSARWPQTSVTNPISVQAPHFKAGCGGIDAFAGSFSFLADPDMLVQKLQNILQNSAGLVFQMALDTLCPKCAAIMTTMESIGNTLNGLALDDCKAAKALTSGLKSQMEKINDTEKSNAVNEMVGVTGKSFTAVDNWLKARSGDWNDLMAEKTGGNPGQKQLLTDCPANIKELLPLEKDQYPVSLLSYYFKRKGITSSEYADLARGMMGDIILLDTQGPTAVKRIGPCPQNTSIISTGLQVYKKQESAASNVDGDCIAVDASNITGPVATNLANISKAMKNKNITIDGTLRTFIDNLGAPIHYALRMGVASGTEVQFEKELAAVISFNYLSMALRDIVSDTRKVSYIDATLVGSNKPKCSTGTVLAKLEEILPEFIADATVGQKYLDQQAEAAVTGYIKSLELGWKLSEIGTRIEAASARAFGPSVAARIRAKMRNYR